MKIGELALHAQLRASTIRYYEKIGLLPVPERIGGQRRYPTDALNRVLLIRFAREMGFRLDEVRVFLNGLRNDTPVGPRWKKLAHRKIRQIEQSMQQARRLKTLLEHLLNCQCVSLQTCVERLKLSPNLRAIRRNSDFLSAEEPLSKS